MRNSRLLQVSAAVLRVSTAVDFCCSAVLPFYIVPYCTVGK